MELVHSPMGLRQRKYREIYRSRLSGFYNGYYHAFLILGVGLYEIYFATRHISNVFEVGMAFCASGVFICPVGGVPVSSLLSTSAFEIPVLAPDLCASHPDASPVLYGGGATIRQP